MVLFARLCLLFWACSVPCAVAHSAYRASLTFWLCSPDRGHVTLVFKPSEDEEVAFTRAIIPGSGDACTSQYRIDGRQVSSAAYVDRLATYGILVKARNFLVFQASLAGWMGISSGAVPVTVRLSFSEGGPQQAPAMHIWDGGVPPCDVSPIVVHAGRH